MTNHEDIVLLYTGTEINANVLKEILEDNQIGALIKNSLKSGLTAGFGGGYAEAEAQLYVTQKHLEKAKKLLDEFLKSLEKN
jgi:hypothetical protein